MHVNHDAVDPVVYVIRNRGVKISVVSDLGIMNDELLDEMKNSNIMAIEANHDPEMLKNGPYTEALKRRIRSDHGHLSNEQSAEAIYSSASDGTSIILTHLRPARKVAKRPVGPAPIITRSYSSILRRLKNYTKTLVWSNLYIRL